MTQDEYSRRKRFRCVHGHNGNSHPRCFEQANCIAEQVGHLDIETTGLNANYDYIISYAITTPQKTYGRVLTPQEVLDWDTLDKNLMQEFCEDARKFDRLTVYWGSNRRHDLPFLRSRALKNKCDFPKYKEILLTDVYDLCKNKLRLNYFRLANVCDFLKIPAKEHKLDPEKWQQAKLGHKPSLTWIWEHNVEDTYSLMKVYEIMKDYSKLTKTSI